MWHGSLIIDPCHETHTRVSKMKQPRCQGVLGAQKPKDASSLASAADAPDSTRQAPQPWPFTSDETRQGHCFIDSG